MCTRVLWADAAGAVLVGRNMDYGVDLQTNLWAFPRGQERDDAVDGSLRWTSRFGSLAAGAYDVATADGLNEAGLGTRSPPSRTPSPGSRSRGCRSCPTATPGPAGR